MNRSEGLKTLTKRSRVAAWGVVACSLFVGGGDVWAQGPGEPQPAASPPASAQADAATQKAEKHYEAGIAFVKIDKWAEAREEFRQAYEASAQPKYLAALIKAEIATGQDANAVTHLTELLRRKAELDANTAGEAEKKLAELRAKVGEATITVNVEGAEVLVDGVVIGRSPLSGTVLVNAGRRVFQARRAGFVTGEQAVDVAPGSAPRVALGLMKDTGPGNEEGGGANKTLLYTGAAVAGGLALVGIGTFIGAVALYGPAEDKLAGKCESNCKEEFESLTSTQQALGYTSLFTGIGAGLVGGATFVYWMATKKSNDIEKGPRGGCVIMPGGGGVFVSGQF